ncbi:hypothetical protein KKG31_00800 [Patescibacteria group bacterium]|nr:hypothetical protein [Patescibacteria group bacterium]
MAKKVYSAKPHTLKDNKESKLSREAEQYFKNKNRKNRQPSKDREKIEDFARNVLFKNFQEALDSSQTSNTYLFELLKKHRVKKELHDGLYKINIIKKNEK